MAYDQVKQYDEDSAHTTGDKGMQILAVRKDTAASLAGTDGDYQPPITDSSGRLWVNASGAAVPVTDNSGSLTVDDGGGSLTVDGAVTVSGTVTANAGTGFASVQTEDAAAAGGETGTMILGVRNDAAASKTSADGDFSAIATDSAGRVGIADLGGAISVDDNGGSLTVDGTVAATQSGTWNIGTVTTVTNVVHVDDNSSTLSIDDGGGSITVDGTVTATNPSVIVDDAAFTPASTSVTMLGATFDDVTPDSVNEGDGGAIRMSANRNLYTTLRDAAGNERGANVNASNQLTVSVDNTVTVASHAVTNAGTFVVQENGAALTSLQLLDDVVATDGSAALTKLYQVGGTDGTNAQIISTNSSGHVNIADGGNTISIDDGAGSITVDGTVAVSGTVTVDTELPTAAALADNTANPTVPATGAFLMGFDGTTWDRVRADGGSVFIQDGGNSITVDGTVAVSGTVTTTNASIVVDDAAFTPATTSVMMAGFEFDDTTPDSVNEGDAGAARMSANRNIYTQIRDNAGNERGLNIDANGEIGIGAIRTSVTPGTGATNLGKAEDAAHASGDVGVMALAVSNEANTARAADGDYLPIATDTEGNVRVVGNRDHDAVDAGEVVGTGGRAIAHGTNPTAVAAADRTAWYFNRAGVPFVIAGHPNIVTVRANYTAAQTDTAIVTVASGLKIVVTRCSVTADNANTVDVQARIGFGATTTPTTTGVVLTHPGIAAGSGVIEGNGSGILGVGADGEDLRITSEVPTTGSIDVVVSYYTIES